MGQKMAYEYFSVDDSGQFSFFRIPKALFTEKEFEALSTEAKLLYGILLDRISLSRKNGWIDDSGRVYVIYTIAELKEILHMSHTTVVKILKELDSASGIGLIEKCQQGCNRPSVIYVKNFIKRARGHPSGRRGFGIPENGNPEVKNLEFRNSRNWNPGVPEIGIPEFQKLESNYTEKSKTDKSDTEESERVPAPGGKESAFYDFYGRFRNVRLSGEEYQELCGMYPHDWQDLIEKLSVYMKSSGKDYPNHFATMIRWAREDGIRAVGDGCRDDEGEYL